jgi:hypothetical protein
LKERGIFFDPSPSENSIFITNPSSRPVRNILFVTPDCNIGFVPLLSPNISLPVGSSTGDYFKFLPQYTLMRNFIIDTLIEPNKIANFWIPPKEASKININILGATGSEKCFIPNK